MGRIAAAVVCVFWLVAGGSRAFALNPSLDVSQYAHTSWKVSDGFFNGSIYAIAQTSDGYLWLGTDFGLLRFDGVRAVPWQPPQNQRLPSDFIYSLRTGRDGTLWIGTDHGLARWDGHALIGYEQVPERRIGNILEDRDGRLWFTNANRDTGQWTLCEVQGDRVQCYGGDPPSGTGPIGLFQDSRGTLWAGGSEGVWRWQPDHPAFYPLAADPLSGYPGLAEGADGALLIAVAGGIGRLIDGRAELTFPFPKWLPHAACRLLLRDRDGDLWAATITSGLVHVHEKVLDVFTQSDGLSGDIVFSVFEDREGSIWVGTNGGLDRFRDVAAAAFSRRQGLWNANAAALVASKDGSVWVATAGALNKLTNQRVVVYHSGQPETETSTLQRDSRERRQIASAWADRPTTIFEDRKGRIWTSTAGATGYLANDRFVPINGLVTGFTRAIVEDRDSLWVVSDERGVFRVSDDGQLVAQLPLTTFGRHDTISAAVADPARSGLWLGFSDGGVVRFVDGRIAASYGAAEGLGRRVHQLALDTDGTLWGATEGGLSRVRAGRVATLSSRNGLPCDDVVWMVKDNSRSMWLSTHCGLVRVERDEIDGWAAAVDMDSNAPRKVRVAAFDATDGVRTLVAENPVTAPAVLSADGRVWFHSPDGVTVIDPRRLPFNNVPPPVYVERIVADRHEALLDANSHPTLPALTRDLEIDYVALSLAAPEKNRFRYRLDGYDRDWQDAGNRRQAFYTNLPPRTYRFRVIAANNSGVWNETGASVDFSIAPAYYQTRLFQVFSVGAVFALLWTAHRIRLRIVERHEAQISALNERLMKAQEQERIRMAGELHDGVMQQMLAVTMMLGTAKRKVAGNADAQESIDRIQQKVIQAGTDIRQISHALHPPFLQEEGLPGALRSYCDQFRVASGIAVQCDADESARELSRGAALALFRITQEALGNAAKHARANRISVSLRRSNGAVRLTVSDDGVGFEQSRLGVSGGLGLVMMRERAGQLNGTFEFDTAPGRGTTIRVVVPFR